jgi:hypothetical protein
MSKSKKNSIMQKHIVPILFDKLTYNHLQHKRIEEVSESPSQSDERSQIQGQNSVRRRVAQLYKDVDHLEVEEMLKVRDKPLYDNRSFVMLGCFALWHEE